MKAPEAYQTMRVFHHSKMLVKRRQEKQPLEKEFESIDAVKRAEVGSGAYLAGIGYCYFKNL